MDSYCATPSLPPILNLTFSLLSTPPPPQFINFVTFPLALSSSNGHDCYNFTQHLIHISSFMYSSHICFLSSLILKILTSTANPTTFILSLPLLFTVQKFNRGLLPQPCSPLKKGDAHYGLDTLQQATTIMVNTLNNSQQFQAIPTLLFLSSQQTIQAFSESGCQTILTLQGSYQATLALSKSY